MFLSLLSSILSISSLLIFNSPYKSNINEIHDSSETINLKIENTNFDKNETLKHNRKISSNSFASSDDKNIIDILTHISIIKDDIKKLKTDLEIEKMELKNLKNTFSRTFENLMSKVYIQQQEYFNSIIYRINEQKNKIYQLDQHIIKNESLIKNCININIPNERRKKKNTIYDCYSFFCKCSGYDNEADTEWDIREGN